MTDTNQPGLRANDCQAQGCHNEPMRGGTVCTVHFPRPDTNQPQQDNFNFSLTGHIMYNDTAQVHTELDCWCYRREAEQPQQDELKQIVIRVCTGCLAGDVGTCHEPGCHFCHISLTDVTNTPFPEGSYEEYRPSPHALVSDDLEQILQKVHNHGFYHDSMFAEKREDTLTVAEAVAAINTLRAKDIAVAELRGRFDEAREIAMGSGAYHDQEEYCVPKNLIIERVHKHEQALAQLEGIQK